jgi:hypothetical protein
MITFLEVFRRGGGRFPPLGLIFTRGVFPLPAIGILPGGRYPYPRANRESEGWQGHLLPGKLLCTRTVLVWKGPQRVCSRRLTTSICMERTRKKQSRLRLTCIT